MMCQPLSSPILWAAVAIVTFVAPLPAVAAPDTEVTGVLDVIAASGAADRPAGAAAAPGGAGSEGLAFDAQGAATWVWTLEGGLQPGITFGARARRTVEVQPADLRLPAAQLPRRTRVETDAWVDLAGVFVRGGWGEVAVGYGPGAAETSLVTVPGMFGLAERGGISASGFADVGVPEPGLSGSAARVALTSVRIIGLRGSLSWTPRSDGGRPDAPRAARLPGARLDDVAEAGLDATVRLGGLEYGVGLSRSQGMLSVPGPVAGAGLAPSVRSEIDMTALSFRVDGDGWRAGLSRRSGWQGPVLGEHESSELAVGVDRGGWSWLVHAWQSEDSLQPQSVRGVSIRGGFSVSERVLLVGGVTSGQREPRPSLFPVLWLGKSGSMALSQVSQSPIKGRGGKVAAWGKPPRLVRCAARDV